MNHAEEQQLKRTVRDLEQRLARAEKTIAILTQQMGHALGPQEGPPAPKRRSSMASALLDRSVRVLERVGSR